MIKLYRRTFLSVWLERLAFIGAVWLAILAYNSRDSVGDWFSSALREIGLDSGPMQRGR